MALTFDAALNEIADKLNVGEEARSEFLLDVDIICGKVELALLENNSIFKGALINMKRTACYVKGRAIDFPDNFSSYLLLNLPKLEIKPEFDVAHPFSVLLKSHVSHPIVENGCINLANLNFLLRRELEKLCNSLPIIRGSANKSFKLTYQTDSVVGFPKLIAEEQTTYFQPLRIMFHLETAFEFDAEEYKLVAHFRPGDDTPSELIIDHWVAVPVDFGHFIPCKILPQALELANQKKAKRAMQLTHQFFNDNNHVLVPQHKRIYFVIQQHKDTNYTNRPLSSIFMDILMCHYRSIVAAGRIEALQDTSQNDALEYLRIRIKLVDKLKYFQHRDSATVSELMTVFGL